MVNGGRINYELSCIIKPARERGPCERLQRCVPLALQTLLLQGALSYTVLIALCKQCVDIVLSLHHTSLRRASPRALRW